MATTKVSALTAKTTPSGSEELLINDGGVSKKITIANLPDNDTTYSNFAGTTAGLVPTSTTGDDTKFLRADGTWVVPTDTDTTYTSSDFTHNSLSGVTANEHIDWTVDQGATNLHSGNYTDTNTTYTSSDFTHNSLSGVTANEHIDWTTDQGATNIHAGNYTDTDTVYTHPTGDGNLHVPANGTTNNGKYLQASGTAGTYTWEAVDALPTQTGNSGKYLGTDGTTATWNTLDTDANSTTKGLYEHANTIAANYTIATGNNALTAGPITINTGVSVTVPTGSTWVVA